MSRFEDTLQRDLNVIADRATPSPHAWQQIQRRIVDQEPPQETEIIMLTDNTTRPRRWPVLAAAAAVLALVVGGVALVNRGDNTNDPADVPAPLPEPDDAVDETTSDAVVEPSPSDIDAETPQAEVWSLDAGAELPVGLSARTIEPFEYWSEALGVPATFIVPTRMRSDLIEPGAIRLTANGDDGRLQGVVMSRVGSWFTPEEAVDPEFTGLGSVDADDIDEWLDLNGITTDESSTVTIGGHSSQYHAFTVSVDRPNVLDDPAACQQPEPCFWADSASADTDDPTTRGDQAMTPGWQYRLWLVDMNGYEPLLIRGYGQLGAPQTQEWLDGVVPQMVESIELGEPTYAVPNGSASLSTEVVASGSWTDADFSETPNDDGSSDMSWVTTFEGDMRGEAPTGGTWFFDDSGSTGATVMEFSGEIDGLGTGTLTIRDEHVGQPTFLPVAVVVGGTGDFAGARGWGLFDPGGVANTYEFHVSVPVVRPADVSARTVSLTAESALTDWVESPTDSGDRAQFTYRSAAEYTGDFVGTDISRGTSRIERDGTGRGNNTGLLTGSIEGVGTGTLSIEGVWRDDGAASATYRYIGMASITGGTGDFVGASGYIRYDSSNPVESFAVTLELALPER